MFIPFELRSDRDPDFFSPLSRIRIQGNKFRILIPALHSTYLSRIELLAPYLFLELLHPLTNRLGVEDVLVFQGGNVLLLKSTGIYIMQNTKWYDVVEVARERKTDILHKKRGKRP